ncbi:MAG: DUF448 domain-containing protein [Firmicutes bacterium]|uniref:DUF448 domain-containing protein n=1 Tax=Candidatus Alloenteromonas pullistercoris TaxID=2840785 RepID=A0A9D9DH32_9FIRM|nr:DUF448 domain-containing protein [Candidatus Enteromonas pullistercoris]
MEKGSLLRLCLLPTPHIDDSGTEKGRGAYVYPRYSALTSAKGLSALKRLGVLPDSPLYAELLRRCPDAP